MISLNFNKILKIIFIIEMKSLKNVLLNESKQYWCLYVDVDPNDSKKDKYIGVFDTRGRANAAKERWIKKHPEDKRKVALKDLPDGPGQLFYF